METIYYTASKVVVWLDLSAELPADKTAAAFSVLERITQLYKDHSIRLDPDDTYRRSKIMVTMHEMMCLRQTTPYAGMCLRRTISRARITLSLVQVSRGSC